MGDGDSGEIINALLSIFDFELVITQVKSKLLINDIYKRGNDKIISVTVHVNHGALT